MLKRITTLIAGLAVASVAVVGIANPVTAATPLPTPGTPVTTDVTTTSVAISWTPSSGPVASYTVLKAGLMGLFSPLATTSGTTYTATGLTPDTVNMFRVVATATSGSGYTDSSPSGILYVTTRPLPESVPPTTPGTPWAQFVSTTFITLNFTHSTDNARVAGYVAQRQINGVWTDVATNDITTVYVHGLTPNTTYTFVIVAFDPNGNRSPQSAPLTVTTRQLAALPVCKTRIVTFGQNYYLNITVENMTAAAVENWSVTLALPADHVIQQVISGTLTRVGGQGTLRGASYNAKLNAGTATTLTVLGGYPAGSALPSTFVLNGTTPCTT